MESVIEPFIGAHVSLIPDENKIIVSSKVHLMD